MYILKFLIFDPYGLKKLIDSPPFGFGVGAFEIKSVEPVSKDFYLSHRYWYN
jgi:hypothetical protein